MLFHYPGLELVKLHAEALDLPLLEAPVSSDEYLSLVHALRKAKTVCGCSYVSSGALLSHSQRVRFIMAGAEAGVRLYTPSWGRDQAKYLIELVNAGIEFILVSIQAYGLPPSLLGRIVDRSLAEEIVKLAREHGFNPAFEGGEAETLVVDAPLFRKRLDVKGVVERIGPDHYVYRIVEAKLTPKRG